MQIKDRLLKVPIYQPGKTMDEVKKEYGIKQIIKLASNENPYGPTEKVKEKLVEELENLAIYPDGAGQIIKNKLANFYNIAPEQLILGNGSDEIIQFISRTYLDTEAEVIMANPTFPIYKSTALMEGAKIVEIPLESGKHNLSKMAEAITEKTAVIWICNPNNPTGTIVTEEEIVLFMNQVREDILVVIDEAYVEYVTDESFPNGLNLLSKYTNLMILRTFSKIYGLASLRIGYGVANTKIINDLQRVRQPFNTNVLAQRAAEIAITDQSYIRVCKENNKKNMKDFITVLDRLHVDYYPSETNFILVKHQKDDDYIFQYFLKNGIIIRAGNKIGIPGSCRITIGTSEQMERVADVFKQIF